MGLFLAFAAGVARIGPARTILSVDRCRTTPNPAKHSSSYALNVTTSRSRQARSSIGQGKLQKGRPARVRPAAGTPTTPIA